jgi:hypothetical protein
MGRQILEIVRLSKIDEVTFPEPVRFVFPPPERGGPFVSEIRRALAPKGRLRLSATAANVFADLDPGDSEPCLVALDTIVRSDATGLRRMLHSVLPYVDEIVLGVDDRSDLETLGVARAYADCVFTFGASDLKLSDEAWRANKIDFSAARNLGRQRVHASWALVIDSDEYLRETVDLRKAVAVAPDDIGALSPTVVILEDGVQTFEQRDCQRLARTRFRWHQATHNQLRIESTIEPPKIATVIVSDLSLRAHSEVERRYIQRHEGVDDLAERAAAGDLMSLFHLAKHRTAIGDITEAVRLVEDFRLRVEPNSPLLIQRQWLSLAMARRFFVDEGRLDEANRWACRTLLDGPSVPAFCMLGDIAESEGDLTRALRWYQAACAVQDDDRLGWPGVTELRWGRLSGIQHALTQPAAPRADPAPV